MRKNRYRSVLRLRHFPIYCLKSSFPSSSVPCPFPLSDETNLFNMKLPIHPSSKPIRSTTSFFSDMSPVCSSDAYLIEDPHWEEVVVHSTMLPLHLRQSGKSYSPIEDKARLDDASTEPPSMSSILWIIIAQEWLLTLLTNLLPYSQLLSMVWSALYGTPYSLEKSLVGYIWGTLPLVVHNTRALPFSSVWLV